MWLEFETRMRGLIRRVIEPALEISIEDRDLNLDLEIKIETLIDKIDVLEHALFRKDKKNPN